MAKQQPTVATTEETPEVVPTPTIRAKFQCSSVVDTSQGEDESKRVYMSPVTGDPVDGSENENKSFSKDTPKGVLELAISNPDALDFFEAGKQYYFDITHAD